MKKPSLEPESSASANSAMAAWGKETVGDKGKVVDGGGFEPPKSVTADLQSAPFGHSGTHPWKGNLVGAGEGT